MLATSAEGTPVLSLPASNAPTPTHTLIQISDTHIVRPGELLYDKVDTHAVLAAVLAQLEASPLRIGVLLLTGDLADSGDPLAYRRLRELVEPVAARMGVPVLYGMGNHDARGPFRAGLLGVEPTTEPHDYTRWVGDLRVVVLDSTEPGQHGGLLSTAQLDWLADELATPAPAGTVLALHHPPVPSPIAAVNTLLLAEPERLAAVLAGSDVKIVLTGHAHHASAGVLGGVPVWVAGATAYRAQVVGPADRMTGLVGGEYTRVDVYPTGAVATTVPIGPADVLYDMSLDDLTRHAAEYTAHAAQATHAAL
ncbi:metallophosphoesterase [Frankia sp. AvcI1]|uniref:metallophosphoesterase family protein n=1 Tax=Frankia sp. AvcI1 TaxID=573496 RepID=UPI0006EC1201|nr:metallophosphoesterase [Frankia sp. AvcI1]